MRDFNVIVLVSEQRLNGVWCKCSDAVLKKIKRNRQSIMTGVVVPQLRTFLRVRGRAVTSTRSGLKKKTKTKEKTENNDNHKIMATIITVRTARERCVRFPARAKQDAAAFLSYYIVIIRIAGRENRECFSNVTRDKRAHCSGGARDFILGGPIGGL